MAIETQVILKQIYIILLESKNIEQARRKVALLIPKEDLALINEEMKALLELEE